MVFSSDSEFDDDDNFMDDDSEFDDGSGEESESDYEEVRYCRCWYHTFALPVPLILLGGSTKDEELPASTRVHFWDEKYGT